MALFGMTASTAINIFARAVVRERKIPFEIASPESEITREKAMEGMICYAVTDTNVLVSALLSNNDKAAPVQIIGRLIAGEIIPTYSKEIVSEYREVLNRKRFKFGTVDTLESE